MMRSHPQNDLISYGLMSSSRNLNIESTCGGGGGGGGGGVDVHAGRDEKQKINFAWHYY